MSSFGPPLIAMCMSAATHVHKDLGSRCHFVDLLWHVMIIMAVALKGVVLLSARQIMLATLITSSTFKPHGTDEQLS